MERWFDLNGANLRVQSEDGPLLQPMLHYLEGMAAEPATSADFTLTLERSGTPPDAPPEADLFYEGMLPEGLIGRFYLLDDVRWITIPGEISLVVDKPSREARIIVRRGREALVSGTAAIHAIAAALAECRQHLIHGAAIRLPAEDKAFLLLAPSGVGKTTSALALALDGFGLLTDDAAVLDVDRLASGERPRIWGLPRPLKVHQRTAAMLPRVGSVLGDKWDSAGEQPLMRDALRTIVEVPDVKPFPLAAIVILSSRVQGDHVIRPMKRSEILVRTATDNVFRGPREVLAGDVQRFQAISSAIAIADGYELNVGSNLHTLGSTVASALAA